MLSRRRFAATAALGFALPVRLAAQQAAGPPQLADLLAAVPDGLRREVFRAWDDRDRTHWDWTPGPRGGALIGGLPAGLVELLPGLSSIGLARARRIVELEEILAGIEGNPRFRDRTRYHLALFGEPDTDARWGWRLEGHHLSVNITVAGERVIGATPMFMGANPRVAPDGRETLAEQTAAAAALWQGLTSVQVTRARIGAPGTRALMRADSLRPEAGLPGLPLAELTPAQRRLAVRLVESYVESAEPVFARAYMEALPVDRMVIGLRGRGPGSGSHYHRIEVPPELGTGPWIEHDARDGGSHIHAVWRDTGLDWGGPA